MSKPLLASAWAAAFFDIGKSAGEAGFEPIAQLEFQTAAREASTFDEIEEGVEEFVCEALKGFDVGSVAVELPRSQHGDAACVSVARLPESTDVSWISLNYCEGSIITFVIPEVTSEALEVECESELLCLSEEADWSLVDEGQELPEGGTPEHIVGFNDLWGAREIGGMQVPS